MSPSTGERVVVFACARANLQAAQKDGQLPQSVSLVELPCTGRISVALVVEAIARGAAGVLVLGRHQSTCRFAGAEDSARERCARAALLLGLGGVSSERVAFVEPEAGPEGPLAAVKGFVSAVAPLGSNALARRKNGRAAAHESLDGVLERLRWVRGEGHPAPAADAAFDHWLRLEGLPVAAPGGAVLLAGQLPELALVGGELFRPLTPAGVLGAGVAVLARLGIVAGVAREVGPGRAGYTMGGDEDSKAQRLEALIAKRAEELPAPPQAQAVACTDDAGAAVVEALGHRALRVDEHPLPERFSLSPAARSDATRYLEGLAARGAAALHVGDAEALFRWAAVARHGAWQSHFVLPVGAAQLAQLSLAKLPLTPSFIAAPLIPARVDALAQEALA